MKRSELVELARLRAFLESGAAEKVRGDLTYREIASAIGTSPSAVWRWNHGERVPRGTAAVAYWRLLQDLMA